MSKFSIHIKCFKFHNDCPKTLFFETHSILYSGLILYDVYTQTREHYLDLLNTPFRNSGYILEVKVSSDKDYILGHSKLNPQL